MIPMISIPIPTEFPWFSQRILQVQGPAARSVRLGTHQKPCGFNGVFSHPGADFYCFDGMMPATFMGFMIFYWVLYGFYLGFMTCYWVHVFFCWGLFVFF
jgi:hypothetical protein